MPEQDITKLRGILAQRRISRKQFAAACGLSPWYVSRILNGSHHGELAKRKVCDGLATLGLEREVCHG